MKNDKQKGFALVLSLVLLLAMSLMGGALIVIASSDHQSNNSSDEYQQTFYVAETALLQAQKSLINKMLGPINVGTGNRDYDGRIFPQNQLLTEDNLLDQTTPCYRSFRNLSRNDDSFRAVEHVREQSFLDLLFPIFNDGNAGLAINSSIDDQDALDREQESIRIYYYEFFSVSSGTSEYKGTGVSLKKGSGAAQRKGTAYKIYGCGMMGDINDPNNPEIIVPLETLIVLSH